MKIEVNANIKASVAKAWLMYTNPSHIVNWNFASDDWYCPTAQNELKVGGFLKARMESKDGKYGFDYIAEYKEIVQNKYLKSMLGNDREVEVFFYQNLDNTSVKIIFDAENENSLELQKQGWQAILDNFKKYVEQEI